MFKHISGLGKKSFLTIFGLIACLVLFVMNIGINDAGYRTVIQYPNGTLTVKFDAGIYYPFFGKTTEWPDYISFDFSTPDSSCDYDDKEGIRVRYQDGGEGNICGMANVQLPLDEENMLAFHKRYRDVNGAKTRLLEQQFPKALNLTAALVSSEEAYATKRAEFIRMSKEQSEKGLYKTVLETKEIIVTNSEGKSEKQIKEVPKVMEVNGVPITQGSDFDLFGLKVVQFDLKGWGFEPKTIQQIQKKRDAEMAIITAKANANKAYYQEQETIAEGKKNVAAAEYAARVEAEKEIQQAERDKTLALIEATKQKERAIELTQAAIEGTKQKQQEAIQAIEEAKIVKTLADAEAYHLRETQKAGELKLKIDALVTIAQFQADAQAKRAVPSTVIYSGEGGDKMGSSNDVSNVLDTQLLKNLSNLNLSIR